jgi:hypothetical protein
LTDVPLLATRVRRRSSRAGDCGYRYRVRVLDLIIVPRPGAFFSVETWRSSDRS